MEIIIETFRARGEPSSSEIRARPAPGQGLSRDLRVECSKNMRQSHPVGTFFKVWAQLTDRQGTRFLYSNWRDPYKVLTAAEAKAFIRRQYATRRKYPKDMRAEAPRA